MDAPAVERVPAPTTRGASLTGLCARLIIPVWGEKYVARLDCACLPAVLAPGNLPFLAGQMDCELVVVTEERLFERVRSLASVRAAQRYCRLKLVAMDDVLSHPSYYGYTITHALYRGFTDLGEQAKDVWCLFLNADFLLADGSYRALVERIRAGERYILAPSYCTIEENVWPALTGRVAADGGVLAVAPREMAGLILDNRHYTIRSKTINWRMYRIDHVDQFYYLVDNDTLLGRQIPIAVVAFRPERVPREPVAFWDYGVKAEICPESRHCVIGDSDDFLMMELRKSRAMGDWLKLGWLDPDEIAEQLSNWSTADQRACADFNLALHRNALPAGFEHGARALDEFWGNIARRLAPEARDHRNHYIWTGVVALHNEWLQSRERAAADTRGNTPNADDAGNDTPAGSGTLERSSVRAIAGFTGAAAGALFSGRLREAKRRTYDAMRTGYRILFGRIPEIGRAHPQWADLRPVIARISALGRERARFLSLWSVPDSAIASHVGRWVGEFDTAHPEDPLDDRLFDALKAAGPYDACFLELARDELVAFGRLHPRLRTLVRKGGWILVFYRTKGLEHVTARDFQLISGALPACDLGELQFRGSTVLHFLQRLWESEQTRVARGRVADFLRFAGLAGIGGLAAILANTLSARREPGRLPGSCTSLFLQVKVI